MQPLGVGGVDVRDFEVKNCYESSGRDWSARSAPIGGERVCLKRMVGKIENFFEVSGSCRCRVQTRSLFFERSPRVHSGSFSIRFFVHPVSHFGLVPSNITD
ncbi:hypothetical protein TNCV_568061 [Trichonephila clavipes]|nr:hypothetical protein TNCV_568061 [Trichonephila clavipes]